MQRYFEKISLSEFRKFFDDNLYDTYCLPSRKTAKSAGYDFLAIEDIVIKPGEIKKIPTGYKAFMQEDEVLLVVVRSSMGFKYNVRMCNQVGVIDSDYYNNSDNEGHIFVALQNEGNEEYVIKKGTGYAQGIFTKYLTCGEDVDILRTGGMGSTDKKEGKENE